MDATYRVVFCGEVLTGFELSSVKQTAEVRLKAPPAMLTQLFSGRRVILKKGITLDIGSRYLQELESMGMKASLEPETEVPAAPVAGMSASAPAIAPVPKDLGSYAPPTESSVFDTRNAPTEATIVVPRQQQPLRAPPPATEQTVFVPRPDTSERPAPNPSVEPTVFVPRSDSIKRNFDSERTLIASAETLAEYFIPKASAHPADDPSLLEDSGATAAMPDPVEHRDVRGSNDKTVLAPPPPAPAPQPAATSQPYRTGSSETTVFVAPRRGTSDPTMTGATGARPGALSDEARRSLMDEYERGDQEEIDARAPRGGKGRTLLILLVLIAAIGAAAYYYLFMQ
ncbi:hypothetical protein [Uliginosibacterium gangwonense]|uniref:hypothetical protein n=1 Tax=Uliginosibacterium gangwonense TaxID=392736 RepID=UPI00036EC9E8|nr:hypothetical protein [Uliginosibacterium gangwonense]